MAVVIGSNTASLSAQRRLAEVTATSSKIYEQLSSGQRINRASDDAAGLAISSTLNAKSRIYTVATRIASAAVADLNGDGRLDILQASVSSDSVSVLLNQGNGTFVTNPAKAVTRLVFGDARGMAQVNQVDLTTQVRARNAMTILDNRLERLSAQAGVFGSIESRLQAAAQIISASIENFRAAESRIKDADVGHAAAELTRTQIVQQAASAVLAQANQQSQVALQLLKL